MERIIEWLKDEHQEHPNAKIDIYVGSDFENCGLDDLELSLEEAIERLTKKIEKMYNLNFSDYTFDDFFVGCYEYGDCTHNDIELMYFLNDIIEEGEEIIYIWIKGQYI